MTHPDSPEFLAILERVPRWHMLTPGVDKPKDRLESDIARAKMESEIQCEGCGYFHNLRRCPKCTRTVQKHILYAPIDGSKPSWITSGSARITDAIRTVDRRAIDMNILGMASEAQNNFWRAVTDCNTSEIYYT